MNLRNGQLFKTFFRLLNFNFTISDHWYVEIKTRVGRRFVFEKSSLSSHSNPLVFVCSDPETPVGFPVR